MSDVQYVLPQTGDLTVSAETANKLILSGEGDAALLYLYILMHHGVLSADDAAFQMKKSVTAVKDAAKKLNALGIVRYDDSGAGMRSLDPVEMKKYSAEEVTRGAAENPQFKALLYEIPKIFGRELSPYEAGSIYGMLDYLRLPPEVILHMIKYCVADYRERYNSRGIPAMSYIEKTAYIWVREGILSIGQAEAFIKQQSEKRLRQNSFTEVLHITGRELTKTEKGYIDKWVQAGFTPECAAIAYDRMMSAISKFSWGYINAIMRKWASSSLYTPEDIEKYDKKPSKSRSAPVQHEDIPEEGEAERMRRLLEQIKNS